VTEGQRAADVLNRFLFSVHTKDHLNPKEKRLQLSIQTFCMDVCHGVDQWLDEI
jgi:hypothetical protein